jgi:hypothetical protein
MWSPPPESNRRPHPYHGTTRNRCAERRFPWSLATVGTKVIGSLSAKECALPLPMCGSSLELAIIPVRDRELSPRCLPLIISRSPSEAGVSNLGSMTGHQARRPRPVRPPPGSLRRRPRPATLRSLAPARYRRANGPGGGRGRTACSRSQYAPLQRGRPHRRSHRPDQHRLVWLLVLGGEAVAVQIGGPAAVGELHTKPQQRIGEWFAVHGVRAAAHRDRPRQPLEDKAGFPGWVSGYATVLSGGVPGFARPPAAARASG